MFIVFLDVDIDGVDICYGIIGVIGDVVYWG